MNEAEELLALTFDVNPAIMSISRISDSILLRVNQSYERVLGFTAEELIGSSALDLGIFINHQERARIATLIAEQGYVRDFETQLRTKSGAIISVLASMTRIVVRGDFCFLSVFYDITERKKVEKKLTESQELFSRAFELNPSMMAIIRVADNSYININASFERVLGYSKQDVMGRTAIELNLAVLTNERTEVVRSIDANGYFRDFEIQLRSKSGGIIDIIGSAQVVEFNNEPCILSVFFDVTERKLTNRLLSEKIAELDEFTHIASHDLQEPLRKLVSFSELLKTDLPKELPPQAESDLLHITAAAHRMQRLIRDLLEFSRMGRREMMSRVCPLDSCLDRALEDLSLKIEEKHALIKRSTLPEIRGDEQMLTHVFLNLVGNALKFIPEQRKPVITIVAYQEEEFWRIEIADNGIGIEPQYFGQIFAPFKRLHGEETYEGSGIGLAMSKKIVERHGGYIGVSSEPGSGSCFYFALPRHDLRK